MNVFGKIGLLIKIISSWYYDDKVPAWTNHILTSNILWFGPGSRLFFECVCERERERERERGGRKKLAIMRQAGKLGDAERKH